MESKPSSIKTSSEKKEYSVNQYEQISQTAFPVAYARTFSDIPYAQEVFNEFKALRGIDDNSLFTGSPYRVNLAAQFEARQKLIDKLVHLSNSKQILELASGLTTRGLEMTQNPDLTYIETDLPAMLEEKKKIVISLTEKEVVPMRTNLQFTPANALILAELEEATKEFNSGEPITVVNEGLLRYLNFEEKAVVAKNILTLLRKYGGVWITPDISSMRLIAEDAQVAKRRLEGLSGLAGRDLSKNLFEGPAEAITFFENLGFSVESHSFKEVQGDLVSPQRLGIPPEEVDEVLRNAVTFVLRPRI